MVFVPKTWEDTPSEDTPIDATGLNDLETRIGPNIRDEASDFVFATTDDVIVIDGSSTTDGQVEVQSVDWTGASAGDFTLTIPTIGTTGAIPWDDDGTVLGSEIIGLLAGSGVSQQDTQIFQVQLFDGASYVNYSTMTADDSGLTGSVTITTLNDGSPTVYVYYEIPSNAEVSIPVGSQIRVINLPNGSFGAGVLGKVHAGVTVWGSDGGISGPIEITNPRVEPVAQQDFLKLGTDFWYVVGWNPDD